jgi:LysR family nitrogen assimilation transcriptional regulator
MHLTLRQLRYFVEIARSGSFSRAAEHLSVAQPALSQNIAALEETLGSRLFERHARGVDLSPAGHRLHARALELLAGFDALKDHVDGREARPSGIVRVVLAGSVSTAVIASLLGRVAERYPGIELAVAEGVSTEARVQIESGQAHLALMPGPAELQGMETLPVFEERFLMMGAYAAMQGEPAEVRFAEVAQRRLAAPDRAHDLRKVIERAAGAIYQALDVRYELNSPPMLTAVVKAGLAFAIMPASICREALAAGSIAARPIVEPELTRVQALVWRRDRALAPASVAVRDVIVEIVAELVTGGALDGRLIGPLHKL